MNENKTIKLIIIIVLIFLIAFSIVVGIKFLLKDKSFKGDNLNLVFEEEIKDKFNFLEKDVIYFLENVSVDDVDKYELSYKNTKNDIFLSFKDGQGNDYSATVKSLDLNDKNILYVLKNYTNYFKHKTIKNVAYVFDRHKTWLPCNRAIGEKCVGTILMSDDKIYIIIVQNDGAKLSFVESFKEYNEINGTLLDYLRKNKKILKRISKDLDNYSENLKEADSLVSEDIRDFGLKLWDAYIELDIEKLQNYYADNVWFFMDKNEWFGSEMDGVNGDIDDILLLTEGKKEFFMVERGKLLDAYLENKKEEFEEEIDEMRESGINFIYINDLMEVCKSEKKSDFLKHFKVDSSDILMFVKNMESDYNDICTIDGKFYTPERSWFIKKTNDGYRVVTDYTE